MAPGDSSLDRRPDGTRVLKSWELGTGPSRLIAVRSVEPCRVPVWIYGAGSAAVVSRSYRYESSSRRRPLA